MSLLRLPSAWPARLAAIAAGLAMSLACQAAPASAKEGVEVAPSTLRQLLATAPSEAQALRELAEHWGERLPPGVSCATLRRQAALACFDSRGGLALLRQLDRPVLLRLTLSPTGPPRALVLRAVGPDQVGLLVDGRTVRVPLAWLSEVWRGEFLALWRAPAAYPGGVAPSLPEPLSQWLQLQLRPPIANAPELQAPPPEALRLRLAAFQMAEGLKPDGKPGPLTMMALNRRLGLAEPRLVLLAP